MVWHMRHTSPPDRGAWAAYVSAAIEASGLSKAETARQIGTDAGTIFRWLSGKHAPERADVVARFAQATGVDLDEALVAAGLRPNADPVHRPARQDPPIDKDTLYLLRRLADPEVSAEEKAYIRSTIQRAAQLLQEQEEAEQQLRRRAAG